MFTFRMSDMPQKTEGLCIKEEVTLEKEEFVFTDRLNKLKELMLGDSDMDPGKGLASDEFLFIAANANHGFEVLVTLGVTVGLGVLSA